MLKLVDKVVRATQGKVEEARAFRRQEGDEENGKRDQLRAKAVYNNGPAAAFQFADRLPETACMCCIK